jgi:16S rRNA (adenine1518-N6/adenine1519-N6)-dimethyltransferase
MALEQTPNLTPAFFLQRRGGQRRSAKRKNINMNLLEETKNICKQNNITPSRSKGQNFLIDEDVCDKIVVAADLNKDDTILEVGPGFGILTEKLARKVKKVVAVELDDKLAKTLREKLATDGIKNVEVINEDILKLRIAVILEQASSGERSDRISRSYRPSPSSGLQDDIKYKIVANLPYNITSIFLRKFLTAENKPLSITLMLQKEVAERILAKPGEMSLLAVSVQYYAEVKIINIISKEKFWPTPEVDSAIIKIDVKSKNVLSVDKESDFFRLVKIGFSSRRKMLKNNLSAGYHVSQEIAKNKIKTAGLDEKIRAQDLSLADWEKLFVQFG